MNYYFLTIGMIIVILLVGFGCYECADRIEPEPGKLYSMGYGRLGKGRVYKFIEKWISRDD